MAPESPKKKENEKSFHYSIPKLFGSSNTLKEIHEKFAKSYKELVSKNENGEEKNCIDKSIYCDKWFRMPNQTKEGVDGTEHFIVKGELIDFVVEFILDDAVDITNKKFLNNKKLKRFLPITATHKLVISCVMSKMRGSKAYRHRRVLIRQTPVMSNLQLPSGTAMQFEH